VVYAALIIVMVVGSLTFVTMSRREDPEILIRTAVVTTQWPGAPTKKVEELISDPLEKRLMELEEVDEIETENLVGVSIIKVTVEDQYVDLDPIWTRLRNKVDEVAPTLPAGSRPPLVNSDFGDVYALVLALRQVPLDGEDEIRQPYSYRQLEVIAEDLRDQLKKLNTVARVDFYGVQDEVIYLDVDSGAWSQLGLTSDSLAGLLDSRNIVEPGGSLDSAGGRYPVVPSGEFESVGQIASVPIGVSKAGIPIRLGDAPLSIERRYEDPPRRLARFATAEEQPERSIYMMLTMKGGRNVVQMGEDVDALLTRLQTTQLPPDIRLTRVNDLPRQVDGLIKDFVTNLWQAIVIVLVVALLMMGWRPALVMAAAVPLSMVAAIAVVAQLGVELEQFSIASLIIAMGMVVDNAIVVSDNTVRLLNEGRSRFDAAVEGASELAIPVLTSTLTTVAAFLPLAFMAGSSGEYMRSLPVVVSVTLLCSYLVAMCVTPLLCTILLKPDLKAAESSGGGDSGYERLVHWCLNHKAPTLLTAGAAFLLSLQLVPLIGSQFFPAGLRDQMFIDIWLPEGSPISATDAVAQQVQDLVLETRMRDLDGEQVDGLANVVGFVGGGAPRLMLTMEGEQTYPNYAFILVNTSNPLLSGDWVNELREKAQAIPGARIDVARFQLGPPVKYPVEVRLIGDDDTVLREAGEVAMAVLRGIPGMSSVSTDWGNSGYQVEVEINSEQANLAGVSNRDVAKSLNALISGATLTTYREGDHQVRVVLRLRGGQRHSLDDLSGLYVTGKNGKVPLSTLASVNVSWQPSRISRVDNRRALTVRGKVKPGVLSNDVTAQALPGIQEIVDALPAGYALDVRGEAYETSKSQSKITKAFGIAFMLIILVLVTQYNSFAKPIVILITVPLALIGALIGLFVTGWPLGFMPSLGIVSLAGVVINNAIVLIDFVETRIAGGAPLRPAVAEAGKLRMKPIVLTTLTTVGGMLPLALFAGPMWAGMAWAVIFGLALSTALTLLVIPTVYVTFVENLGVKVEGYDPGATPPVATAPPATTPPAPNSGPPDVMDSGPHGAPI
jgi:multidrug efflux pump subunit AcrB